MKKWMPCVAVVALLMAACGSPKLETVEQNLSTTEQIRSAAMAGDLDTVKRAVESDPNCIKDVDSFGMTLLHHAARRSRLDVAKYLLEQGADVNAIDFNDDTPLDLAEDVNESEKLIELLESHAGR